MTYNIGIALSGGGARGIAHVGVLKGLEELGLSPDCIAGTSAGAIAGCLYAAGLSPDEIFEFVKETSLFKTFRLGLPNKGVADLLYVKKQMAKFISQRSFETLEKKLFVAVTNLNKGKAEIIDSGDDLLDVVIASAAIPLVFKPITINGDVYVDGGVIKNFPVSALSSRCSKVIGVNVIPKVEVSKKEVKSVIGIAYRCFELNIWSNSQPERAQCDLLIEPLEMCQYSIFNFRKAKELYELGYKWIMEREEVVKQLTMRNDE